MKNLKQTNENKANVKELALEELRNTEGGRSIRIPFRWPRPQPLYSRVPFCGTTFRFGF